MFIAACLQEPRRGSSLKSTDRLTDKEDAVHTHTHIHTHRNITQPIPKKGNAKECSNYYTVALSSHASKGMLKILQAKLQQYVNHELPDV